MAKAPKLSKEEKRELKRKQKEEIKAAKKAGTYNPDDYPDEGGVGLIILATLFILLVWLAIFAILVRMDVGGLGSTIMYPVLKDIPYLNMILPEVEPPQDSAYTFDTIDDAIKRIQELERQLAEAVEADTERNAKMAELENLVAQLQPYKDSVDQFNAQRQKFYQEVVFSDDAPDIKEYKAYYESINPASAENIYRQVVQQLEEDSMLSDYAAAYSAMEPAQAASIFDGMQDNFRLVARILSVMSAEDRGNILAQMNTENAAAITAMMEPK